MTVVSLAIFVVRDIVRDGTEVGLSPFVVVLPADSFLSSFLSLSPFPPSSSITVTVVGGAQFLRRFFILRDSLIVSPIGILTIDKLITKNISFGLLPRNSHRPDLFVNLMMLFLEVAIWGHEYVGWRHIKST